MDNQLSSIVKRRSNSDSRLWDEDLTPVAVTSRGIFPWRLIRGVVSSPHVLRAHFDFSYRPPSSASNMTTPENNHGPKHRCTCPPKVKGPSADIEENGVTAIMLSTWQTSSVGTWSNSHSPDPPLDTLEPKQPPTAVSGASDGCNSSFESLKHALSSRSGRELLRALPTDRAIGVIDVLEQVSAKRLGCIVTS